VYRAQHDSGERKWPSFGRLPRLLLIVPLAFAASLMFGRSPAAHAQDAAPARVSAPVQLLERSYRQQPSAFTAVRVRRGDTLSALSRSHYGTAAYWPDLALVNHLAHPDSIRAGQVLLFPLHPRYVKPPTELAARLASYNSQSVAVGGSWPGGAFGACVVDRESGGSSQVMNDTGHYGLYQFSLGTWEEYGGSAALFGHASIAYQEQIFMNAMARGGENNWSPYDHC
jgi:LysM repeat protein